MARGDTGNGRSAGWGRDTEEVFYDVDTRNPDGSITRTRKLLTYVDKAGRTRAKKLSKQEANHWRREHELDQVFNEKVNVQVSDFVSELATAIRYREKTGLHEGDWVEDPERVFTDHRVFGEEVAIAAGVKMQITVSIDGSRSMYANDIMSRAGAAFVAIHKMIRAAQAELPEGSIIYAPFTFAHDGFQDKGKRAYQLHDAGALAYADTSVMAGNGSDTWIYPLFECIEKWEIEHSDPSIYRLDIIITDGVLEHPKDVVKANEIQERRNGRLSTVMLNFLPTREWGEYRLPERCVQYAVTRDNVSQTMRKVIAESLGELL